eukprot:TRINITY_DN38187_c0_g1_i1.p1 TRINITY_DN38187_c0_g1~~TRINITY_DN38187_c0_g1_i1.p1  ORF type:complete len:274 (-),score=33.66 TRINITY_DN38187_c0_g1_i1:145-966(-)
MSINLRSSFDRTGVARNNDIKKYVRNKGIFCIRQHSNNSVSQLNESTFVKRRDVLIGLSSSIGVLGIFPSICGPAYAFKPDRQLSPLEYGIMEGLFDRLVGKGKYPLMLRLAFHDAGTYSAMDNTGGPNASIQYELDRPENKGLKRGWKLIGEVQKSVEGTPLAFLLSPADIIALAGAYSVKATGGPQIEVKIGRVAATEADPEDRLPGENFSISEIKQSFERAGFTIPEMVALSGAHTIGGKGFGNPSKFDNAYYKTLLQRPWDDPKLKWGK